MGVSEEVNRENEGGQIATNSAESFPEIMKNKTSWFEKRKRVLGRINTNLLILS